MCSLTVAGSLLQPPASSPVPIRCWDRLIPGILRILRMFLFQLGMELGGCSSSQGGASGMDPALAALPGCCGALPAVCWCPGVPLVLSHSRAQPRVLGSPFLQQHQMLSLQFEFSHLIHFRD